MLVPERPWKITKTMADKIAGNKDAFACPDLAHLLPHLLYESQQSPHFISPEKETFQQAEELFKQLLSNKFKPLHKIWAKDLGFMCKRLETARGNWLIIRESKEKRTGKGFFLFNMSSPQLPCLQLPHSYKDWYTGELGLYMALEGLFSVVAWNTFPRRSKNESSPCDLAHLEDSYFAALALAYSQVNPQGKIIQLHSFANGFRKTPQGEQADLILSSGLHKPKPWFANQAEQIKRALPGYVVRTFPWEVGELGGTQNSIGQAINQLGRGRFLHLEMASRLRIDLLDKKKLRKKLNQSLN